MNNEIQFLLYQLPDEGGKVQVVIKDETIWATQKAMAQLFVVGIPAISKHLTHIFDEGELDKDTTVSKMEIVVNRGFRVTRCHVTRCQARCDSRFGRSVSKRQNYKS